LQFRRIATFIKKTVVASVYENNEKKWCNLRFEVDEVVFRNER
jgi:hypothetical protein